MKHVLKLACSQCDAQETFAADRRYLIVALLDASKWHTRPTADGRGAIVACPDCHATEETHAANAERVFAGAA